MRSNNWDIWLSRFGLGLIICYCVIASVFYSYFAQLHLTLKFVSVPIFVSEIILFVCLLIFISVVIKDRFFSRRTIFLLCFYFAWLSVKILIDYHNDGNLTFRNAALFYYPIFAVFTYCFYQKARIHFKDLMPLAYLSATILFLKIMVVWYWWTYATLFVIAVLNTSSVKLRWLGCGFLAGILLLGKEYLYEGPRAHFVSVFGAVLFMVIYFVFLLVKRREIIRMRILLIGFVFFILGCLFFAEHNTVSSVSSIRTMIKTFNFFDERYQAKQKAFVPVKLETHLYNHKRFKDIFVANKELNGNGILHNIVNDKVKESRPLDLDENNIVFRLFVWRDMARELIENKAWWGFSLGHPQRSRTLEVLNWASGEWGRDGWIAPHNSFFHIIYRSGILGVLLIGVFLYMLIKLIMDFYRMCSIEGGLLVGALLYWLELSNFFVILEFPYNAILFWSLFGITMAFRDGLKMENLRKKV